LHRLAPVPGPRQRALTCFDTLLWNTVALVDHIMLTTPCGGLGLQACLIMLLNFLSVGLLVRALGQLAHLRQRLRKAARPSRQPAPLQLADQSQQVLVHCSAMYCGSQSNTDRDSFGITGTGFPWVLGRPVFTLPEGCWIWPSMVFST